MKKKKLQCSVPTLLLAGVLCLTLAACGAKQSSDMLASDTDSAASAALPVKAMNAKRVDENPYMAKSDANIHHDGYNTDSTDEVLPLGIYPEINVSYEKTNANASPAIYFDSYGHAVVPLLGGIAIRDLNAEETTTLGYEGKQKAFERSPQGHPPRYDGRGSAEPAGGQQNFRKSRG